MKKEHNNIKQYLNKGISTTAGILILVLVAIVAGGIITWQMWPEKEAPSPFPTGSPTPTTTPSPNPSPTEPYINIISPNGGEGWEIGEIYMIKWNCPNNAEADMVDIFIKDKRESLEELVGSLIKCSLEKYSWKVESISSGQDSFKVQLRHVAGAQPVIDESDDYFSIVAKDEIADWKTYTNTKLNYTLKVPQDFHNRAKPSYWISESQDSSITLRGQEGSASYTMSVHYMPDAEFHNPPVNTNLVDWLKKWDSVSEELQDITNPNFEVDSIPAVKFYELSMPQAYDRDLIYLIKDNKVILIQFDIAFEEERELYYEILSTFKFID